jgi:hypothetical protein
MTDRLEKEVEHDAHEQAAVDLGLPYKIYRWPATPDFGA